MSTNSFFISELSKNAPKRTPPRCYNVHNVCTCIQAIVDVYICCTHVVVCIQSRPHELSKAKY